MPAAPILTRMHLIILCSFAIPCLASPVYTATADINLHHYQSTDSDVILSIPKGAEVKVLDSSYGNWWQVQYQGRSGYTQSNYLEYSLVNDQIDYQPIGGASSLYNSRPSLILNNQIALYEHPTSSSAVITRIPQNGAVKIVDDSSTSWWMVHYKGYTGYLKKTALSGDPAPAQERPVSQDNSYQLTAATSLRQEPDGKVLLRFMPGDQVEVLDDTGEWWWKVDFKGTIGWVKRRLLERL